MNTKHYTYTFILTSGYGSRLS